MDGQMICQECHHLHVLKFGHMYHSLAKNIDPNTKNHSLPTSMKKATTFFNDEYLKDTKACSDSHYFYFKCQCFHSYRKNDKPHDLRLAIYLITGEVKHAFCSCVAGRIGFCNHVLALMMKVSLFSFYE